MINFLHALKLQKPSYQKLGGYKVRQGTNQIDVFLILSSNQSLKNKRSKFFQNGNTD